MVIENLLKLLIFIAFFILLQRSRLFEVIEVKIVSVLIAIFMCAILGVALINIWADDYLKVYVSMPSIKIMEDYYEQFYNSKTERIT